MGLNNLFFNNRTKITSQLHINLKTLKRNDYAINSFDCLLIYIFEKFHNDR